MQTYGNLRKLGAESAASVDVNILQLELSGFGVELRGQQVYSKLTGLVAKHGIGNVRTVAMNALDRYTQGGDETAIQMTPEGYIMDRLRRHNWSRNSHKS